MVKLWSTEHTYSHPWARTTSAFWRKYPNIDAPQVRGLDCVSRSLDSDGRLVSHRIVKSDVPLLNYMKKKLGVGSDWIGAEVSVVDPSTQTMILKSRNLTASGLVEVEETCTYSAIPNSQSTHYTQSVRITAFLPFLSSQMESWSVKNIAEKSALGKQTIETLCQRIQQDGVLSLFDTLGKLETPATVTPPAPAASS